ncbi:MAG: Mfa1 family fimbria major subunit [Muribaculaceae bacterium]|nr:Mfa1 family fimbria major subunit [Muribaculaceae bacterium]
MNKFAKLFMGIAAVAALSACSQDEPMDNGTDNGTGSGEKAYMAVTVNSAGNMSRSTSDEGYQPGDDDERNEAENKVKSAKFFFFDENGNYVLNAKILNLAESSAPTTGKIEWESANVLVLEDVNSKNYPKYMLTVLNAEDFQASETLDATCKDLSLYADNFKSGGNNFVMTTSSYRREDTNKWYMVNELVNANFADTPDAALNAKTDGTTNVKPVEVYVERLAAKVQLNIKATPLAGTNRYKLEQTIAGDENDDNNPDNTADTEIYLEVLGWTLNATAIDSYMSKQIKSEWWTATKAPFSGWERTADFRTIWAESRSYDYVKSAETQANRLNYKKIADLQGFKSNFGVGNTTSKSLYCYENTNLPDYIVTKTEGDANSQFQVYNSRVTHVILNTKLCDADGNALDMIKYRGILFKTDSFKKYVLNDIKNRFDSKLNYYKPVGDTYKQVDIEDIDFAQKGASYEDVLLVVAKGTTELYAMKEDGTVDTSVNKVSDFQADLTKYLSNTTNTASRYNGGSNIYFIPIEHNAVANVKKDDEGYYGVVRNHWYKLDINKFTKVGHGLWNPDDVDTPIIPDEPEDPLYYLSAKINILSWRVITQNVDL